jgi:hypothetical protein
MKFEKVLAGFAGDEQIDDSEAIDFVRYKVRNQLKLAYFTLIVSQTWFCV